MSGISLTASMRSNLLSLQNIASQQNIVQNRLATGLKVSSAIDNPSSYYTASSLNNRAADLTALLDAMSQGIQTIKAANEAIDSGTKFLEQAKAVANQNLTSQSSVDVDVNAAINEQNAQRLAAAGSAPAPDRAWLLANGADFVVESESELREALANAAAGQKIVVNAAINIEINDVSERLIVAEGVELIGSTALSAAAVNFDGSYKGQLIITNNTQSDTLTLQGNNRLSDLKINAHSAQMAPNISFKGGTINNLDLQTTGGYYSLRIGGGQSCNLTGNINIITSNSALGNANAIRINAATTVNVSAVMNIETSGKSMHGIVNGGNLNFSDGSLINILVRGSSAALDNHYGGKITIGAAKLNLISENLYALFNECWDTSSGGNTILIKSGAEINAKAQSLFVNAPSKTANPVTGRNDNYFEIEAGVKVFFHDLDNNRRGNYTTGIMWEKSLTYDDQHQENEKYNLDILAADGWEYSGNMFFSSDNNFIRQFKEILNQYDSLIKDASYKGINLLDSQRLKINFNEDRSSGIEILGISALSQDLGLTVEAWNSSEDIEQSVSELEEAINILRGYASQYGNYYSIVTTRQDFTENLINVLEEGADKLTLADMNQESANMLALQTAQQLAVNSLSLASQASQAVLRLF